MMVGGSVEGSRVASVIRARAWRSWCPFKVVRRLVQQLRARLGGRDRQQLPAPAQRHPGHRAARQHLGDDLGDPTQRLLDIVGLQQQHGQRAQPGCQRLVHAAPVVHLRHREPPPPAEQPARSALSHCAERYAPYQSSAIHARTESTIRPACASPAHRSARWSSGCVTDRARRRALPSATGCHR